MAEPEGSTMTVRFIVSRTSEWDDTVPPCEEAIPTKVKRFDVRTTKTFEEYDARFARGSSIQMAGRFIDRGTEHKVIPGVGISRRVEDGPGWTVELDLEGLLAFVTKYDAVILSNKPAWVDSIEDYAPSIEIYDENRE